MLANISAYTDTGLSQICILTCHTHVTQLDLNMFISYFHSKSYILTSYTQIQSMLSNPRPSSVVLTLHTERQKARGIPNSKIYAKLFLHLPSVLQSRGAISHFDISKGYILKSSLCFLCRCGCLLRVEIRK